MRLLEAMTIGLPSGDGALCGRGARAGAEGDRARRRRRARAGPGPRADGAQAFVREMVERIDVPLVIDADGLNALAGVFPGPLPGRGAGRRS